MIVYRDMTSFLPIQPVLFSINYSKVVRNKTFELQIQYISYDPNTIVLICVVTPEEDNLCVLYIYTGGLLANHLAENICKWLPCTVIS